MQTGALAQKVGGLGIVRRGLRGWIVPLLFCLALAFPWVAGDFYVRLAIEAFLLGAIALSVDILLGCAGLLSLGQAIVTPGPCGMVWPQKPFVQPGSKLQ